MKVFSQLVSAQMENKASDYSSGTKGRFWFNTGSSLAKYDNGSAIKTIVSTDDTQTLTNKTLVSVAGSVGTVAVGVGATDTGFYSSGTGEVAISLAGRKNFSVQDSGGPILNIVPDGTNLSAYFRLSLGTAYLSISGGTGAASGGSIRYYGASHGSKPSALEFFNDSSTIGATNSSGKWTIGASGGTQIHDVNGGLKLTQALTVPEIATPSTPASGFGSFYFKSDGNPYVKNDSGTESLVATNQVPRSMVWVYTGNGHGSTNTKIRRFSAATTNTGTAITYADSATNGGSFTVNEDGVYSITYVDSYSGGTTLHGVSLNATGGDLTTDVDGLAVAKLVTMQHNAVANNRGCCAATVLLSSGDVIRAHTRGLNDFTTGILFIITQVSK